MDLQGQKENFCDEAAVTGMGIISPIGCSAEDVLGALKTCADGIGEAKKIDASKFSSRLCAEVKGFDASANMRARELSTFTDPFFRLAISAARMAIKDAGLGDFELSPEAGKTAVVFATCNAGLNSAEAEYKKKYEDASVEYGLAECLQSEFYSPAKALAKCLNVSGECYVINTACSGATAAIGLAEALVEEGRFETVIVGGADAMSLSNYAGFNAIKVVCAQKTAPFSEPVGMNIGEGAAFWIVEKMPKALSRGAKIYGKIIGHATGADAHHPTQPDPRGNGAHWVMLGALKDAGVELSDLGCINAHGSGTLANDRAEANALDKFCGQNRIPVTSTKSYIGHCMGATGILEATCQLLAMNCGFIPPTLRFGAPRAGCERVAVAGKIAESKYGCFLSANYAFAGNNAAVVVASRDFNAPKKNPRKTDVFITGLGAVSGLGLDLGGQLDALAEGKSALERAERLASARVAGLVKLPPLRTLDRRVDFSGMNNISAYATIAARHALDSAALQVRRGNCGSVGLAVSVCRGSDNSAHMRGVFADPSRRGDVGCFSSVTANSTAGWVSKALCIKGPNITLTGGLNSGIQTAGYVFGLLARGRAEACLAVAADEVYGQQLEGYWNVGLLWGGGEEADFKLRSGSDFKTVLGEGAAALLLESKDSVVSRGAKPYAKVLSYAGTMDRVDFMSANLSEEGLNGAVDIALSEAGLSAGEIDVVVWAPRGDAQDEKLLKLLSGRFPGAFAATCVFNTGYAETASALLGLVYALKSAAEGRRLWPQATGDGRLDALTPPENPKRILCVGGGHSANNHALVVEV